MNALSRTLQTMVYGPTEGLSAEEAAQILWTTYVEILAGSEPDDEDDESYTRQDATFHVRRWLMSVPLDSDWGPAFVARQVEILTAHFLAGDARIRNVLATFLIEHILEDEAYEAFFAGWGEHDELRAPYEQCLSFGRWVRSRGGSWPL